MKQRRNPLSHLGWLGFLGILGILSGAVTMLVLFLFFFFFTYRAKVPDELFWANVHKAAARTLAVNLTLTCVTLLGIYARGMHYRLGIPVEEKTAFTWCRPSSGSKPCCSRALPTGSSSSPSAPSSLC
jgi:uncharacterized iron-regulated membrane protein